MDHALVADESSRLLACTLLRHAQPDDPDAAFFATVLGKCLALAIRAAAACRQRARALLETQPRRAGRHQRGAGSAATAAPGL